MNAILQNPLRIVPTDGWPDEALPLTAELEPPAAFPMDAMPPVLAEYGRVIQRCLKKDPMRSARGYLDHNEWGKPPPSLLQKQRLGSLRRCWRLCWLHNFVGCRQPGQCPPAFGGARAEKARIEIGQELPTF